MSNINAAVLALIEEEPTVRIRRPSRHPTVEELAAAVDSDDWRNDSGEPTRPVTLTNEALEALRAIKGRYVPNAYINDTRS